MQHDTWKQILQSVANATLMLAIMLMLSGAFLVHKIHSLTAEVISNVKVDLLEAIDKDVETAAKTLKQGERDLQGIAQRLESIEKYPERLLTPDAQRTINLLLSELNRLNGTLKQVVSNREALTDRAIHTLASEFAQTYIAIRNCRIAPNTPFKNSPPRLNKRKLAPSHRESLFRNTPMKQGRV